MDQVSTQRDSSAPLESRAAVSSSLDPPMSYPDASYDPNALFTPAAPMFTPAPPQMSVAPPAPASTPRSPAPARRPPGTNPPGQGPGPGGPTPQGPAAPGSQGPGQDATQGSDPGGTDGGTSDAPLMSVDPSLAPGGTSTEPGQSSQPGTADATAQGDAPAAAAPQAQASPRRDHPGLVPPKPARLRGTDPPRVEEPPRLDRAAVLRVRKKTGLTPDEHHDRIRAEVRRVARLAHRLQVFAVHTIEGIAGDTRRSMVERADAALAATEGAVARVQAEFARVRVSLQTLRDTTIARIGDADVTTEAQLQGSYDLATSGMYTNLLTSSTAVTAVRDQAATELRSLVQTTRDRYVTIPSLGYVPGGGMSVMPPSPMHTEGSRLASDLRSGALAVTTGTDDQAGLPAVFRSRTDRINRYMGHRRAQYTPDHAHQKQLDYVRGNTTRANQLCSEATQQRLVLALFGLVDPQADRMALVSEQDDASQSLETGDERSGADRAKRYHQHIVGHACDNAGIRLNDTETRVVDGLRSAGRAIYQALLDQAEAAENGLLTSLPELAEMYAEHVRRMDPMLPPRRLLDWHKLHPRLASLLHALPPLEARQVESTRVQAREAIKAGDEALKQHLASVHKAVREANAAAGEAALQAELTATMALEAVLGQSLLESGEAIRRGQVQAERVVARLAEQPGGVRTAIDRWLNEGIKPGLDAQLDAEATAYNAEVARLQEDLAAPGGVWQRVDAGVTTELNTRSQNLNDAMPVRSGWSIAGSALFGLVGVGVYLYSTRTKEKIVIDEIGFVPIPGRGALEDTFPGNLRSRMRDKLDDEDYDLGIGLLNGRSPGEIRALAYRSRNKWFSGLDQASLNRLLTRLPPETSEQATPPPTGETVTELENRMLNTPITMEGDYHNPTAVHRFAGNLDRQFTAANGRSDRALVEASGRIETDARQHLGDTYYASVVAPWRLQGFLDDVYREHARMKDPTLTAEAAAALSGEDARLRFADWATRDRTVTTTHRVGHGKEATTYTTTHTEAMDALARDAVRQTVLHGDDADETWIARGAYYLRSADRGGKPSENERLALTKAMEDTAFQRAERDLQRNLARARTDVQAARDAVAAATTPEDRRTAEAGLRRAQGALLQVVAQRRALAERHETRMRAVAERLGLPLGQGATAGTDAVAQRLGVVFGRVNRYGREYGESLARQGRADLTVATLFAAKGSGTDEALLFHNWENRSHAEISAAEARYQRDFRRQEGDPSLRARLLGGTFSELSGDEGQRWELLAEGEPESDLDHIRIAALRWRHQRVNGTGWLGHAFMDGGHSQQMLDARLEQIAQEIRRAGGLPDSTRVFDARGNLTPAAMRAFDPHGNLRGTTPDRGAPGTLRIRRLGMLTEHAASNYQRELDRHESFLTTLITVLAIVVAIALMLIPFVNVVAAGIAVAVLAGVATMVVKSGMRGGRYGWEEMAVDAGMMAVEAATAGLAGGLARGGSLAAGVVRGSAREAAALARLGRVGRIGFGLTQRTGRVGSAMIREGVQQFVNAGAGTAMQDQTWRDGVGEGLLNVAKHGGRAGLTAMVTAGVSEGAMAGLQRIRGGRGAMNLHPDDQGFGGVRPDRPVRAAFAEGATEALGSLAGQGAGRLYDRAVGTRGPDEPWWAGALRDFVSGFGRSLAGSHNRGRYERMRDAIAGQGHPPTPRQLSQLRRAAISAGVVGYGNADWQMELRTALRPQMRGIPMELRPAFARLSDAELTRVATMLRTGDLGTPADRLLIARAIARDLPGVTSIEVSRLLHEANASVRQAEVTEAAQRRAEGRARGELLRSLPPDLRADLRTLPVDAVAGLSPAMLRRLGRALAGGEAPSRQLVDELVAGVLADRPGASRRAVRDEIQRFLATSHETVTAVRAVRQRERSEVTGVFPEAARAGLGALPQPAIRLLRDILVRGDGPTPQELATLSRHAAESGHEGPRGWLQRGLHDALQTVRQQRNDARRERRAARFEHLEGLPDRLRGPLSALPDHALAIALSRLGSGEPLTPRETLDLIRAARSETPELDANGFRRALAAATEHARELQASGRRRDREIRRAAFAGMPPELRPTFRDLRIEVLDGATFAARSGSERRGQAYVEIRDGKLTLVVREGVPLSHLREEGAHLWQTTEPGWRGRIHQLDERRLANWNKMSLPEQLAIKRLVLEMEIDAKTRVIAQLDTESPGSAEAAQNRWSRLQLRNELRQLSSIGLLRRAWIAVGMAPRPPGLEVAPRLLTKTGPTVRGGRPSKAELDAERAFLGQLGDRPPESGDTRAAWARDAWDEVASGRLRSKGAIDTLRTRLGAGLPADQLAARFAELTPHEMLLWHALQVRNRTFNAGDMAERRAVAIGAADDVVAGNLRLNPDDRSTRPYLTIEGLAAPSRPTTPETGKTFLPDEGRSWTGSAEDWHAWLSRGRYTPDNRPGQTRDVAASFAPFARAVGDLLGLTGRTSTEVHQDILDAVTHAVSASGKTPTADLVRHEFKRYFLDPSPGYPNGRVVDLALAPLRGTPPDPAAALARIRAFTRGLNAGDIGNVGERFFEAWTRLTAGIELGRQPVLGPSDHPELGGQLRRPDYASAPDRVLIDVKSHGVGALAEADGRRLADYVRAASADAGARPRGVPGAYDHVRVVFLNPEAARASAALLATLFDLRPGVFSVGVFTPEGRLHVIERAEGLQALDRMVRTEPPDTTPAPRTPAAGGDGGPPGTRASATPDSTVRSRETMGWSWRNLRHVPNTEMSHVESIISAKNWAERVFRGREAALRRAIAEEAPELIRQRQAVDDQIAALATAGSPLGKLHYLVHQEDAYLAAAFPQHLGQIRTIRQQLEALHQQRIALDEQFTRLYLGHLDAMRARLTTFTAVQEATATRAADALPIDTRARNAIVAFRGGDADAVIGQVRQEIAEFALLVGRPDLLTGLRLRFTKDRAEYVHADGVLNVGSELDKRILWHELGHRLENLEPALSQRARHWRDARARSANTGQMPGPVPLNDFFAPRTPYGADELAVRGRFVDPYTGKVYPTRDTEVWSMGLEHFRDSESMMRLLLSDPEHFYLILQRLTR